MNYKLFPVFMAVLILAWTLSLLAANMIRCNKWVGSQTYAFSGGNRYESFSIS